MKIKLREWRKLRNFTMQELSLLSGVSVETIKHIENGTTDNENIKLLTLIKLCKALKCKLYDLLPNELRRYCR